MKWALNLAYVSLLLMLSPVIIWRSLRHGRYRRGWKQKLFGSLPELSGDRPVIWFHAVSVGEVLQLQKVVEQFQIANGETYSIVITTSTDTGFDLAKERFAGCTVCWFPLDFSWSVRTAIRRINPKMVVLMELELWPNFLAACKDAGVRTSLINARMSDRSFSGYSRMSRLVRSLFADFSVVAAQNEQYAERLKRLGTTSERTIVTGSIKFDGVQTDRSNAATQALRQLFDIGPDETVFIAGSTQSPEEQVALDAWQALAAEYPKLRLIIVPRHKERFDDVAALAAKSGASLHRRSQLKTDSVIDHRAVILLDTIGELAACWGLADIALVGGSFGSREGQNMLEPAAYGAAVMFGPRTRNFRDIVERLLNVNGAIRLQSTDDVAVQLRRLQSDKEMRIRYGRTAQNLVIQQKGALQRTIDMLQAELSPQVAPKRHAA